MELDINLELLTGLFAKIERAWVDTRDRSLVYRLAKEHPELRDHLFEFFEDLVLGPEPDPSPAIREAEDRTYEWLQNTGFAIARTAAAHKGSTASPTPQQFASTTDKGAIEAAHEQKTDNWVAFLRQRTNLRIRELANAIPNATTEFVVLVSRHPTVLPESVREALAHYTEDRLGIPRRESLTYLSGSPSLMRAASRSQPFEREPSTFEELLKRAVLTSEQRAFWLRCEKSM